MKLYEPVQAPAARPPRFGLIASAPPAPDGNARWETGFSFQPESCGVSGRETVECLGNTDALSIDYGPDVVKGDPFMVWAGDRCSTFGFERRDWAGRARRQLEATRSYQMAEELWEGTLATADGLENRPLIDVASDTVTNGPTAEVDALACLEAYLADCGQGRQGMVHITPQVLTVLAAHQVLTLSGNLWTTANGHIVVPDAGYTGSGPGGVVAGDSQWGYATSLLYVRLGEVQIVPNSLEQAQDYAQAMDRALNDVIVLAQQLVAIESDECCLGAAEFDVPVCLIGGAS